jgi:hypothetical protein
MEAGVDVEKDESTPDPIGADISVSHNESAVGVRTDDSAVLGSTLAAPMGPFSGMVVLTATAIGHLINGCDLGVKTDKPFRFDQVAVGYTFWAIESMPDVMANVRNRGAYASPLGADPGASRSAVVPAGVGRDASWPPPVASSLRSQKRIGASRPVKSRGACTQGRRPS